MAIPTPDEYAAMLGAALDGGYAYAAVNVTSSQTLNAVVRGFADADADGIVQVTTGGAKYLAGGGDRAAGARALAALARELPRRCRSPCTPTTARPSRSTSSSARCWRPRASASPAASRRCSTRTCSTARRCRWRRTSRSRPSCSRSAASSGSCWRSSVGVVGGEEDGIGGDVDPARLYTTTEDLLRVVEVLGTDGYLLAATFGNVHGVHAAGHVKLRPEILRDGQDALAAAAPGARFAYVFHGSSGTGDAELAEAVSYGVVKVNVDTEMQYAFTRAIADHVLTHYDGVLRVDGAVGDKNAYDPRAWGARAEGAMAARVADECRRLGSAGRSQAASGRSA